MTGIHHRKVSALLFPGLSLLLAGPLAGDPVNFHQVDDKVWRSAQPSAGDFAGFRKLGISDVLNLREWHDDHFVARGTPLCLHRVAMNPGLVREADLVRAVRILRNAPGPIVVHCWHGSDRTGVVVAMYRMAVDGWPREKAIAEFTDPLYGHHASIYPGLRVLLERADIAAFRRAMDQP
jgi:protein tyrosine/serine phosphatase